MFEGNDTPLLANGRRAGVARMPAVSATRRFRRQKRLPEIPEIPEILLRVRNPISTLRQMCLRRSDEVPTRRRGTLSEMCECNSRNEGRKGHVHVARVSPRFPQD